MLYAKILIMPKVYFLKNQIISIFRKIHCQSKHDEFDLSIKRLNCIIQKHAYSSPSMLGNVYWLK